MRLRVITENLSEIIILSHPVDVSATPGSMLATPHDVSATSDRHENSIGDLGILGDGGTIHDSYGLELHENHFRLDKEKK